MALVLKLKRGEDPIDAALRVAARWGLEKEVQDTYDAEKEKGCSDSEAAWNACAEWDILAWEPDAETQRRITAKEAG